MNTFGFNIMPPRTIDFDQFDGRLLNEVLEKEPSFRVCLSCGGCTATCNAGTLIDFNVRKLNLLLRRGETVSLAKEIDKCMLCGKCLLVCPRGINIRNVIMLLKKGAFQLSKSKDQKQTQVSRYKTQDGDRRNSGTQELLQTV